MYLVADKPARADLLNVQSFFAEYFCPICLCRSKTAFINSKKYIYAPLLNNFNFVRRIKEPSIAVIYSAISENRAEYGFKGPSFLYNLKTFEPSSGILIDYMHGICSGVFKTLIDFLFFLNLIKKIHLLRMIFKPIFFRIQALPISSKRNSSFIYI